jgi:hypothetical protein
MSIEPTSAALHHYIIRGLLDTGVCPSNDKLRRSLGVDQPALEGFLRQLESIHGIVLHPDVCAP